LETGDPKLAPGIDKSDNGRVAHNACYVREKDGVQALDDNRGLKFGEKLSLANLQVCCDGVKQNKRESNLVSLHLESGHLKDAIERAERSALRQSSDYNANHPAWKKYDELEAEETSLWAQIAACHDVGSPGSEKDELSLIHNLLSGGSPRPVKRAKHATATKTTTMGDVLPAMLPDNDDPEPDNPDGDNPGRDSDSSD
jgi:hypothetical protein